MNPLCFGGTFFRAVRQCRSQFCVAHWSGFISPRLRPFCEALFLLSSFGLFLSTKTISFPISSNIPPFLLHLFFAVSSGFLASLFWSFPFCG